jgi:hypothetical protein
MVISVVHLLAIADDHRDDRMGSGRAPTRERAARDRGWRQPPAMR